MSNKKIGKIFLIVLIFYIVNSSLSACADNRVLDDVLLNDVRNLIIGKYNLKDYTFLFAIPKDSPATDRGMIWGEMFVFEYQGEKRPAVSFFECGPVASHITPSKIEFSDDDEYLVVESGGESGVMIDVFKVSDLFVRPPGKGWNGTDECVEPITTVGGHLVPVTFYGWYGHVPLIKSTVPLHRVSTSAEVREYEQRGMCCDGVSRVFDWDVSNDEFTLRNSP